MPSINEKISDRSVRHMAYLSRVATHQANLLKEDLQGWREDIEKFLIPLIVSLVRQNSGMLTSAQQSELNRLRFRIQQSTLMEVYGRMESRLQDIIENEADFVTRLFRQLTDYDINDPQPTDNILSLPVQGKTLREWMRTFGDNTAQKFYEDIRDGLLDEKSTDEILDAIDWDSRMSVASAIASTGVLFASSRARDALFDANSEIITGWYWNITLDSRTCLRCVSMHADNPYPLGGRPVAPLHFKCRCFVSPLIEGGGEIPDKDFEPWLWQQPKYVQEEILGKRKRELWQQGQFEIDEFTSGNRILTLDELRRLESDIQG